MMTEPGANPFENAVVCVRAAKCSAGRRPAAGLATSWTGQDAEIGLGMTLGRLTPHAPLAYLRRCRSRKPGYHSCCDQNATPVHRTIPVSRPCLDVRNVVDQALRSRLRILALVDQFATPRAEYFEFDNLNLASSRCLKRLKRIFTMGHAVTPGSDQSYLRNVYQVPSAPMARRHHAHFFFSCMDLAAAGGTRR